MRRERAGKVKKGTLSLKGKNVLVTGGCGFIGSHLIDLMILEKPNQIIVIDRAAKHKRSNLESALEKFSKIKIFQFNLTNYKKLAEVIKKIKIDIVFHLAALSLVESLVNPKKVVLANVRMVLNLLELQRRKFFKTLILVSSSEAYGTANFYPMSEDHPLHPTTPYGASKAAADLIALSYFQTFGNDLTIIRPFNQYGPRQNAWFKGMITQTIQALLSNRRPVIYGTGKQTRDYSFVKDTARGILDSHKYPSTRGRIVNLGSGEKIKIKDLVNNLIQISGKKIEPSFTKGRIADVKGHCADITLAKNLMGWYPKVDLKAGLKETYEWYEKVNVK